MYIYIFTHMHIYIYTDTHTCTYTYVPAVFVTSSIYQNYKGETAPNNSNAYYATMLLGLGRKS